MVLKLGKNLRLQRTFHIVWYKISASSCRLNKAKEVGNRKSCCNHRRKPNFSHPAPSRSRIYCPIRLKLAEWAAKRKAPRRRWKINHRFIIKNTTYCRYLLAALVESDLREGQFLGKKGQGWLFHFCLTDWRKVLILRTRGILLIFMDKKVFQSCLSPSRNEKRSLLHLSINSCVFRRHRKCLVGLRWKIKGSECTQGWIKWQSLSRRVSILCIQWLVSS